MCCRRLLWGTHRTPQALTRMTCLRVSAGNLVINALCVISVLFSRLIPLGKASGMDNGIHVIRVHTRYLVPNEWYHLLCRNFLDWPSNLGLVRRPRRSRQFIRIADPPIRIIAQPRDRLKLGDIHRPALGKHVLADVNVRDVREDQSSRACA